MPSHKNISSGVNIFRNCELSVSMKNWKAYLFLFFGMAFFGSATPVSKLVTEAFPVWIAGALRVLLAFLLLWPFVKMKDLKLFKGRDLWILIGIGAIGVVGFTVFLLMGMKRVSGVMGSIIMSATPAITAGLSVIFFKDNFGWRKGLAISFAVAGILFMHLGGGANSSEESSLLGVALVVLAILCEAGYTLFGKALSKDFKVTDIAAFSALVGFAGFLPGAAVQYDPQMIAELSAADWWAVAWYGLGTMGAGSVLWYKGVQQVEGSTAAAFMGVMPVSALVLSYWLLGESFAWIHLGGFALVFAGVVLIIRAHQKS